MIEQVPSIYGFSTIIIAMIGFIGYTVPMLLIAFFVGIPVRYILKIIVKFLNGPSI